MSRHGVTLALALALVAVVWLLYAPTLRHDFVEFDDNVYVYENEAVQQGLTRDNLLGEWTRLHRGNYHPLTMLSHAADVEWFGLDAGQHHATNVALHAVNAVLLFFLCRRLSGGLAVAAFVAAAFAVHPLNVQSVAWIAERKNVLSTLFWFAGLLLHLSYRSRGGGHRYAGVLACCALGLLAKPMLVTFPFTVWILDALIRAGAVPGISESAIPAARRLWVERLPLFIAAAVVGAVTLVAQAELGAVRTGSEFSMVFRLGTALSAYGWYPLKLAVPAGLTVNYLHPLDNLEAWRALLGATLLLGCGLVAWRARDRHPELAAGWVWYVVTLAPVSGLLTVGFQPWADRYAYVPVIGILWAAAVVVPRIFSNVRLGFAVLAFTLLVGWTATSSTLVPHWRDSIRLFTRAVEAVPENYIAEGNLAKALLDAGRTEESVAHFRAAVAAKPGLGSVHMNLGNALSIRGEIDAAVDSYAEAARLDAQNPIVHFQLGRALAASSRPAEATSAFRQAITLAPDFVDAHLGLAGSLIASGDARGGADALQAALPHVGDPGLRRGIEQRIARLRGRPNDP